MSKHDPWALFLHSMKSPVTKRKYCKRLDKLLLSLGLEGKTTEERARALAEKGKDTEWTFHSVSQFMQAEKERVERKEATASLPGKAAGNVRSCMSNGITLFGIPHPSGARVSTEDWKKLKESINPMLRTIVQT